MFSEQLFDLILDFGEEWKVERVYLNTKTEEVDVFIEFIGHTAEHPVTLAPVQFMTVLPYEDGDI